jgi:hypothetical protein
MKALISVAAIALAAALAAPATAQVAPGLSGAVAHIDASNNSAGDRIAPRGVDLVSISSRSGDGSRAIDFALRNRNESAETAGDVVRRADRTSARFSTRGGVSRATLFAIQNHNASQDGAGDRLSPAFLR